VIPLAWLIFIGAAILEVGGDAVIRKGLRGSGLLIIRMCHVGLLRPGGQYGEMGFFNTAWRLCGRLCADKHLVRTIRLPRRITTATWIGLIVIILGGIIIQFGNKV
jgi:hypothetical protein